MQEKEGDRLPQTENSFQRQKHLSTLIVASIMVQAPSIRPHLPHRPKRGLVEINHTQPTACFKYFTHSISHHLLNIFIRMRTHTVLFYLFYRWKNRGRGINNMLISSNGKTHFKIIISRMSLIFT